MKSDIKQSRRRLLQTLAGTGGVFAAGKILPEHWGRPVIESVLLPTHGQMTGMYVQSAGAATEQTASVEPRNRVARMFYKFFPKAHAADINPDDVYVCVSPNADGTRADIRVYEIFEGPKECGYEPEKILRYTANNVVVPSDDNPLSDQVNECDQAGIGNILDKLGIVRTAHALITRTVDIDSVENGAKGEVNIDGSLWPFDIDPGTCSPPSCGCAPA